MAAAAWSATAQNQIQELQQAVNATNAQIDDLRRRIDAWANQHPNGHGTFPFAPLRMRDHAVGVTTRQGQIRSVTYGDNP